jgi:hypothetical protein
LSGTVWGANGCWLSELCTPKGLESFREIAFKARTSEELMALLSAMATAVLAVIIVTMLYFGRELIIPIAMAILLSFVLAPLVGLLQLCVPKTLSELMM